jgi:hypothetical protein
VKPLRPEVWRELRDGVSYGDVYGFQSGLDGGRGFYVRDRYARGEIKIHVRGFLGDGFGKVGAREYILVTQFASVVDDVAPSVNGCAQMHVDAPLAERGELRDSMLAAVRQLAEIPEGMTDCVLPSMSRLYFRDLVNGSGVNSEEIPSASGVEARFVIADRILRPVGPSVGGASSARQREDGMIQRTPEVRHAVVNEGTEAHGWAFKDDEMKRHLLSVVTYLIPNAVGSVINHRTECFVNRLEVFLGPSQLQQGAIWRFNHRISS